MITHELSNRINLSHYPLNTCSGFLKIATGSFFKPQWDYSFMMPGDLMQAISNGITTKNIIHTLTNKNHDPKSGEANIFSPLHFYEEKKHILPTSGIKGFHSTTAVGLARSIKMYDAKGVVFCHLHHHDLNEGAVFEAIAAADNEKLPVLFILHGYDADSAIYDIDIFGRLKNTFLSYCDNTNLYDSMNAVRKGHRVVTDERSPVIVVGKGTETPHKMLEEFTRQVKGSEMITENSLQALRQRIEEKLGTVQEKVAQKETISPADLSTMTTKVHESKTKDSQEEKVNINMQQAIRKAISHQLRHDKYGIYLTNQDDTEDFEDIKSEIGPRAISLDNSSDLLTGSAVGMGIYNAAIKAVVHPADNAATFWSSLSQIINSTFLSWHTHHQTNLLIRIPLGGYDGSGPFFSQKIETPLLSIPGIRIIAPAFADDAVGLINTAIQSPGITILLENKALRHDSIASASASLDHEIPLGVSKVVKKGKNLTIITWGNTVHFALKAAEKIKNDYHQNVEVLDLRTILPLDKTGILKSISKTRRAMVVSEGYNFGNIGAEIAAMVSRNGFTLLEAPVGRVGSLFAPVPYQPDGEAAVLPSISRIVDEALDILEY